MGTTLGIFNPLANGGWVVPSFGRTHPPAVSFYRLDTCGDVLDESLDAIAAIRSENVLR